MNADFIANLTTSELRLRIAFFDKRLDTLYLQGLPTHDQWEDLKLWREKRSRLMIELEGRPVTFTRRLDLEDIALEAIDGLCRRTCSRLAGVSFIARVLTVPLNEARVIVEDVLTPFTEAIIDAFSALSHTPDEAHDLLLAQIAAVDTAVDQVRAEAANLDRPAIRRSTEDLDPEGAP